MDTQTVKTSANVAEESQGIDPGKRIKGRYLEPLSICPSRPRRESKVRRIASWMGLPSAIHHGGAMRVQRVVMAGSGRESWTLLGDDLRSVEPVERFLAYLAAAERSPNTIKAYAHDLKDWWAYLGRHRLEWQSVTLEDVAGFVAWLRLPPEARDGRVAVLPSVEHHCSAAPGRRPGRRTPLGHRAARGRVP